MNNPVQSSSDRIADLARVSRLLTLLRKKIDNAFSDYESVAFRATPLAHDRRRTLDAMQKTDNIRLRQTRTGFPNHHPVHFH